MARLCLMPETVEKIKKSALMSNLDIQKMIDMPSSAERKAFFEQFIDKDSAQLLNTEFEKAMTSTQKTAFQDFVNSMLSAKQKTGPVYKSMLDKINQLDELGALTPEGKRSILEDLVSDKLGIKLTSQEINDIKIKAEAINKAQEALGDDLGNPNALEKNLAFFKAKSDMDKYLLSKNPAANLKVATGTIGRGMMLASVKSPLLNIGSNIEAGLSEAVARRIGARSIATTNNTLAKKFIDMNWEIYQKTGYDMSRMMNLAEGGVSGERVLGDIVHAQGKGAIRKTGQLVEDVVFKQMMGAPDAMAGGIHFADSVNINALKMANGDRKVAEELMVDAMRMSPTTEVGMMLKKQAVLDAQTATWTNNTWATKISQGVRDILNNISGDLRVGDYLLPFVKTPANIVATGVDYAGAGLLKGAWKIGKSIASGESMSQHALSSAVTDIARGGIGLTGAVIIAANTPLENFVGAYDPSRKQIEALKNSTENSIKIGDKWVSMDWFGPLSIPITAIMYARKYSKGNLADTAIQYGQGVTSAAFSQIPGVSETSQWVDNISSTKPQTAGEAIKTGINYATSELSARLIPSLVADIAKATDPFVRDTTQDPLASLMAKVPGLRQNLPVKTDVFGQDVKSENPLVTILFGSRVKEANNDPTIKEVDRVSSSIGKALSFTDWNTSSSKTLAQFKQKVGNDKFKEAQKLYGTRLKTALDTLFKTSAYKNASDDAKAKAIQDIDSKVQTGVLNKYNFKYKSTTTSDSNLTKALNNIVK